ncbi:MAG: hypothetical protein N3D11_11580 [Candidatus Sumerlaeia bacterium]|nr:hypothetical protein [Candidatus Sumerlaeia bacterium]
MRNLSCHPQHSSHPKNQSIPAPFLLLLVLAMTACETPPVEPLPRPAGLPPAPLFQIYLIHEEPGPNVVERRVEKTGETIFLARRPDATEYDMAWAEVQVDRITGRPSVLAHFTIEGADKLALLTAQNIGRRMALIMDGRVLATPLIIAPIRDGRIRIEGFVSKEQAQRLADAVNRRSR